MDKNQVIGFALLGAILIAFFMLNRPSEEELAVIEREKDSIAQLEVSQSPIAEEAPAELSSGSDPADAGLVQVDSAGETTTIAQREEEFYTLENDKLILKVSNKGGHIAFAQLKEYNRFDSTELILVDNGSNNLSFNYNETSSTENLWFEGAVTDGNNLSLVARDGANQVTYSYKLSENSYDVDFKTKWSGSAPDKLVWNQKLRQQEKRAESERLKSTVYFKKAGEKPDYVSERKNDDEEILEGDESIEWISFKQQFFNQAIVYEDGFRKGSLKQSYIEGEDY